MKHKSQVSSELLYQLADANDHNSYFIRMSQTGYKISISVSENRHSGLKEMLSLRSTFSYIGVPHLKKLLTFFELYNNKILRN